MNLADVPERQHAIYTHDSVRRRQQTYGYTEEELKILLSPMARTGAEPIGSMGTDTPIAVLSRRPRLLYDYFGQLFAQVTNPPLDAIREELVTSLAATIGPEGNLLDPGPASCRQIVLPGPVIDNDELAKILSIDEDGDLPGFRAVRVSGLYRVRDGAAGLKARLTEICRHISEAIGLDDELVDRYFTGTSSRIGGIGLTEIAAEVAARHASAYPANGAERAHRRLEVGGEYQYRREGELHLFNPETVFLLQHATRTRQYEVFKAYTGKVDALAAQAGSLRGLFELRLRDREPVELDEVEPATEIVKRFATGAMSYGSISAEAHETLAIAMNRLGGKSNTGE